MKLSYERLAIATLAAMVTTLIIVTTNRYAVEHQARPLADDLSLPRDRCQPSPGDDFTAPVLVEEPHVAIRAAIEGTRLR